MNDKYVSPKEACIQLGVCNKTLQRWRREEKIKYIKPGSRKYFYCISELISDPVGKIKNDKENFIYCRVSTRGQTEDLERQKEYLRQRYPTHTCISDIGSGLNFKRKGLKKILDSALQRTLGEVVVAYKDRLCRFGFDLVNYIVEQGEGKIVVLNNPESSPTTELVEDLIAIITCFSARIYGLRSYKSKIEEDKNIPK